MWILVQLLRIFYVRYLLAQISPSGHTAPNLHPLPPPFPSVFFNIQNMGLVLSLSNGLEAKKNWVAIGEIFK